MKTLGTKDNQINLDKQLIKSFFKYAKSIFHINLSSFDALPTP